MEIAIAAEQSSSILFLSRLAGGKLADGGRLIMSEAV